MNHDDIREWLRSLDRSERKVVKSEVAKWNNAARKTNGAGPGRPKLISKCQKCAASLGARELQKHRC